MKIYIVIDESLDRPYNIRYEEKYKTFKDSEKALDWAISLGFDTGWGTGVSDTIGMVSMYWGGDRKIMILTTELQE